MVRRLFVVAGFVVAAAGCQRNLDMPPERSQVVLTLGASAPLVAPLETATFTATGGAGGYAYRFADGSPLSGPDATIDPATGAYSAGSTGSATDVVEVEDAAGKTVVASISVSARLAISPVSPSTAPGGQITFSATGGAGTYAYTFESSASGVGVDLQDLGDTALYTAGSTGLVKDYVKVTDRVGATAITAVSVGEALRIYPKTRTVAPNEAASFIALGGKTSYTYSLQSAGSGADAQIDPLLGTYQAGSRSGDAGTGTVEDVILITDSSDVRKTDTAVVTVGPRLSVSPTAAATQPGGRVTLTVAGGKPGYAFAFAPGGNRSGGTIGGDGLYTAGRTGDVSDTLRITDQTGSTVEVTATVGAAVRISPVSASLAPHGNTTFTATGGKPPYRFTFAALRSGAGASVDDTGTYVAGDRPAPDPGVGSIVDVVQVTDSSDVPQSDVANVTVGPRLQLGASAGAVAPRDQVTFTAAGGAPPYTIAFATGGQLSGTDAGLVATGLATALYTAGGTGPVVDVVQVTDAVGKSVSLPVQVGPSLHLAPPTPATSPGGRIDFGASGGGGGYVFSLSAGSGAGADVDAATGLYTAGASGLVTDTVTVTDRLGVAVSASVSVGEAIKVYPQSLTVAPREQASFVAFGGRPPYTWELVTRGSGVDASIGLDGLYAAGSRELGDGTGTVLDTVRVTDSSDVPQSATAEVQVGARLVLTPIATSATPGGKITFAASGGKPGYTFAFAPAGNASAGTIGADGLYTAGAVGTVTDAIKVTDAAGVTLTATIDVGAAIQIAPASASVAPRGAWSFTATGGKPPYRFSFAAVRSGSGATVDGTGAYVAGDRSAPDVGTGTVVDTVLVTDSADVPQGARADVTVGPRLRLDVSAPTVAPLDTATFTASGGAPPYAYAFASGGRLSGPGATIGGTDGVYVAGSGGSAVDVIQVTDGNGATLTATISVSAPVSITPASPSTTPGGRITFTASGGGGGYTFAFQSVASGAGADLAPDGTYTAGANGLVKDYVMVTDRLGASAVTAVSVGDALRIYPKSRAVAPHESLTFIALGGKPPYRYSLASRGSGPGAAVNEDTGEYVAGDRLDLDDGTGTRVDVVRVTDSAEVPKIDEAAIVVGPRVQLLALDRQPYPGDAIALVATGGKPPYVFGFAERLDPAAGDPDREGGGNGGNRSGGTIEAATGIYRPGPSPGTTDWFQVTDSTGAPAAVRSGSPIGGRQLAIGNGVLGCTGANLDGDLSEDVVFFGRTSSAGFEVAKVISGRQLGSASPVLTPYYLTSWSNLVGTAVASDFTGSGRDQVFVMGGHVQLPTGWTSRDDWMMTPDLGGDLTVSQVLGGPGTPMNTQRGAAYWDDAGTPGWRFLTDGDIFGCPAAPPTFARAVRFSWTPGMIVPSAPQCVLLTGGCPLCTGSNWYELIALAVGDFAGDATLDAAWITETTTNSYTATGAAASIAVSTGDGTNFYPAPAKGWPTGYTFVGNWMDTGQTQLVVARPPTGATPATQKDVLIVRLADATGRGKLFLVRDPSVASTWSSPFDPDVTWAGVDGIVPLQPFGRASGTRTSFAAFSKNDGTIVGFELDWAYDPPRFVARAAPLADFSFAVSSACFADVNSDGATDLVATSDWGGTAGIVLGDGTNSAGAVKGVTFGGRPHQLGMTWPVTVADFDQDGFGDVAVGVAGQGLEVMWGGGGEFAWGGQLASVAPGAAVAADFTGDGRRSVLYQEKSGKWGRVTFAGGGTGDFTVVPSIPAVNAANTAPAGSRFFIWSADLGGSAPGDDVMTQDFGDKATAIALIRQDVGTGVERIVEVASQPFPSIPANHGIRECWPTSVGVGVPQVAAICSFRANGAGDPVDSVAIYTATILNRDGVPGTAGAPAFGPWTLRTPLAVGTTAIWSPSAAVTAARVASAGFVRAGLAASPAPGTAVFLMYTDQLYVVEVSVSSGGAWTITPIPVGTTPEVGYPFLAQMGRLDATSDLNVVAGGDDGMLVFRRTGGSTPAWSLLQKIGLPLFPLGVTRLDATSVGDVVAFLGDFNGSGIVPEIVPMLSDGTGKLR